MADAQEFPILVALQNALPGFPPEEFTKSGDVDRDLAKQYFKKMEHEELANFAASALQGLVMFGKVRPPEPSGYSPVASKPSEPFDPEAELRDFQIALIDFVERETAVVRHNVGFVLSRDGGEHRASSDIRAELEEVNRKYHEEANDWLETDDRLESPTDVDEAIRRFEDTRRVLAPLAKKRLQLADELAGAELRELIALKEQKRMSAQGRRAADGRHNKPGGSRDLQDKIRAVWASGKYTSRDRCAEEECGALGMSFSAARKALRNTPEPNRQP